jgi:hypothetical protein
VTNSWRQSSRQPVRFGPDSGVTVQCHWAAHSGAGCRPVSIRGAAGGNRSAGGGARLSCVELCMMWEDIPLNRVVGGQSNCAYVECNDGGACCSQVVHPAKAVVHVCFALNLQCSMDAVDRHRALNLLHSIGAACDAFWDANHRGWSIHMLPRMVTDSLRALLLETNTHSIAKCT